MSSRLRKIFSGPVRLPGWAGGVAAVLAAAACAGLAAAAPVPKGAAAPVTPEHLAASRKNVERIVQGAIWHADTNVNRLPTDITDAAGKPLLSWRVAVLAYIDIELEGLFKQFKLDEPWDGEHNRKLIPKMPKVYAPVRVRAKPGETYYQVFAGDDALFGPNKRPLHPDGIPDGPSGTAMVVEAGEPVIWTKPADLPFDLKKPLPKLGGLFDGEFHVGLCDGSVVLVRKGFDAGEMRKLVTPAGREPLEFHKLRR
jgi:hypothetical protein